MPVKTHLYLLSLFLLPLSATADVTEINAPIKIGVSTALTGDAASYGDGIRKSLEFANKILGNGKYQLIFEDDKCSGREAVTIARRFIDLEKVKYVIGFACSGALLSAAPVYERGQVIAIGVTTSSPRVSDAGKFIFRVSPNDATAARVLVDQMAQNYSQVAVITEETEYCRDLTTAFKQRAGLKNMQVSEEGFISGAHETLSSLLHKIRQREPQALFLNVQAENPLIELVKRVRTMQWDIPIYAAYYPSSQVFLDGVGDGAVGIRFVDLPPVMDYLDQSGRSLYRQFSQESGTELSNEFVFVLAYKTFLAIDQAIQSGEPVREYLLKTTFMGPTGEFHFDHNGDVQGAGLVQVMKEIKAGNAIELMP